MANTETQIVTRRQWAVTSDCPKASSTDRVLRCGRLLVALMTFVMTGLLVRVVQLQLYPPSEITRQINARTSAGMLQARRGNLIDRHGRILATTRLAQRLFVDPKLIEHPNTFSEQVAYRLKYDPAQIEQKISRRLHTRYVVIDPCINDHRQAELQSFQLAGLATQSYPLRQYPYGALAGQLVGFVGTEGTGLEGLERLFDPQLRSQKGWLRYLRDAYSKPLWVEQTAYRPPTDGEQVQLSLDLMVQSIVEDQLSDTCKAFKASAGQMIVMNPRTGEILAMANYPPFEPDEFTTSEAEVWRNRCVTDVFEPGSTFKPFVWAAAIEAGLARLDQIIDCTDHGVYRTVKGRTIHDVRAHGQMTWDQVLVKSSNIGMAIVGQLMSESQMHGAVRAFGFGSTTGSRLPGEVAGLVRPRDKWNHYSLTSVPMGQEIAVTPMQLIRAFSTIANDGILVQPTILAQAPSESDRSATPIYERVLEPATAVTTRRVLRDVVKEGTGRRAKSRFYEIFGKTGTAQIADHDHGGYLEDQYIASFIAGAPFEQPRVTVLCVIHRPDVALGYHGGTVAAPAVRRVIEQTLAYLGVLPKTSSQGPQLGWDWDRERAMTVR